MMYSDDGRPTNFIFRISAEHQHQQEEYFPNWIQFGIPNWVQFGKSGHLKCSVKVTSLGAKPCYKFDRNIPKFPARKNSTSTVGRNLAVKYDLIAQRNSCDSFCCWCHQQLARDWSQCCRGVQELKNCVHFLLQWRWWRYDGNHVRILWLHRPHIMYSDYGRPKVRWLH